MLRYFLTETVAGVVGFWEACYRNALFQDVDYTLSGKSCRLEPEERSIRRVWVLYK